LRTRWCCHRLLDPSQIDVEVTDKFMLYPAQSTSAIISHHPEAIHFCAR
jgi:cobalamin-dependent methionine synthase I